MKFLLFNQSLRIVINFISDTLNNKKYLFMILNLFYKFAFEDAGKISIMVIDGIAIHTPPLGGILDRNYVNECCGVKQFISQLNLYNPF